MKKILTVAILCLGVSGPVHAEITEWRQTFPHPHTLTGSRTHPVVLTPYSAFSADGHLRPGAHTLHTVDATRVESNLKNFRAIYFVGQLIHGTAYVLKRR